MAGSTPARHRVLTAGFIADSDRAERSRLTRDRHRAARFRLLAIVTAVSTVVATGLFGFASYQTAQAQHQATRATQQARLAQAGKLAGEAIGLARATPDLAALLSLESVATAPSQADWGSVGTVLSQRSELSRVLYGSGLEFNAVAYSPGGRLIAGGDESGQIRIWDAASGRRQGAAFPSVSGFSDAPVLGLAFSPDGKVLAAIGDDLQLWNTSSHTPIGRPLVATTNSFIASVAFSPDGKLLAAACNGQISLWNTATWQLAGHAMHAPRRPGTITSRVQPGRRGRGDLH
jgi:hypothetical protein